MIVEITSTKYTMKNKQIQSCLSNFAKEYRVAIVPLLREGVVRELIKVFVTFKSESPE